MTMRIRNVLTEFEAHLEATEAGGNITGKSEWKQYGDGTFRFKIFVRNIELPDGSQIDVLLDDVRVMQLTVQDNQTKADLESPIQLGIPKVQAGQVLRVKFGEIIWAEGIYQAE